MVSIKSYIDLLENVSGVDKFRIVTDIGQT